MRTRSATKGLAISLAASMAAACFNPSLTIDRRSALEQQLTRSAIWRSIQELAVHKDVHEGKWRIKVLAPNPYDESWIRGSLELRLSELGVTMSSEDDEEASVVIVAVVYAGPMPTGRAFASWRAELARDAHRPLRWLANRARVTI